MKLTKSKRRKDKWILNKGEFDITELMELKNKIEDILERESQESVKQ